MVVLALLALQTLPALILPRNLYAVSGQETSVFYEAVAPGPFTATCAKGLNLPDHWVIRPTDVDAGNYPFALANANDHATSTLHVASMAGSGAYKVLVIGDSTVSSPGGTCMAELQRLFQSDPNTIYEEVGTNSGSHGTPAMGTDTFPDSTGKRRTIKVEGWPGKKSTFYSEGVPVDGTYNGGHGPFVFDGAFNFKRYEDTNSISLGAKDWVVFDLGTNDVHTYPSDKAVEDQISKFIQAMDLMIAGVKSAVPGIRIAIGLPVQWATQQGYDTLYNHAEFPNSDRVRRNREMLIRAALAHFDTDAENAQQVWVMSTFLCCDPQTDYPITSITDATGVHQVQNGSVHTTAQGYYRKARSIYAFLKCQG